MDNRWGGAVHPLTRWGGDFLKVRAVMGFAEIAQRARR